MRNKQIIIEADIALEQSDDLPELREHRDLVYEILDVNRMTPEIHAEVTELFMQIRQKIENLTFKNNLIK